MGLECTVLLADNSFYARNGDYGQTTRWDQQSDAFRSIFLQKTSSNPESSVGLMTMAGSAPTLLVAPTREFGKVASALHGIKLQGQVDVMNGISAAQLALKHRQNKNQRQRVIVFVGSPLETASASDLVKLGKRLKKNNVAVDVVSFGEEEENLDKLQQFIDAVNSSDNSHIVSVAAGTGLLSDVIVSSGMLSDDGAGPSAGPSGSNANEAGQAAGQGGDFAVDPNLDPELAMALRMSLEEERARQEAANRAASGSSTASTSASTTAATEATEAAPSTSLTPVPTQPIEHKPSGPPTSTVAPAANVQAADAMDEDEDLAAALALSRDEDGAASAEANADDANMDDDGLTEDEAIARAIALSMREQEPDSGGK